MLSSPEKTTEIVNREILANKLETRIILLSCSRFSSNVVRSYDPSTLFSRFLYFGSESSDTSFERKIHHAHDVSCCGEDQNTAQAISMAITNPNHQYFIHLYPG